MNSEKEKLSLNTIRSKFCCILSSNLEDDYKIINAQKMEEKQTIEQDNLLMY